MKRNYFKKILKCAVLLSGSFLMGLSSKAQTAASYSFAASNGTYTAVSGSATSSSLGATDDDAISSTITFPSGFSFTFTGTTYTTAKVSSNGMLIFGGSGTDAAGNNLASTTTTLRPLLAPLWDDLQCTAGVKYELTGASPNRVLTFEWKEMEWNYGSGTAVISFQIKLFETTNVIQYVYKQESTAVASGSASIGIKGGASASDFISLANASASPTTSTSTSTNSINAKPATGQVYQFTPPSCSGTPTAGSAVASSTSACGGVAINLSLSGSTGAAGLTYIWDTSSTGTGSWGAVSGVTPLTSASYTTIPPSGKITYYRCRVTCTSSGLSATSSSVSVTAGSPLSLPFSESFTSTTLPSCWSVSEGASGASYHWAVTGSDGSHGSSAAALGTPYFAFLNVFNASTSYNPYYITSPAIVMPATYTGDIKLSYYYFLGSSGYLGTSSPNYPLELQVSTNGGLTYTTVYTHNSTNSTFGAWTQKVYDLSSYVGSTINLRWKSMSNYGSSICNQGLDEININVNPLCTGTPVVGTVSSSVSSACAGFPVTIKSVGATKGSTISYQWSSSPDGVAAYTNISGATDTIYTTIPTSGACYKFTVTCGSSSSSATSSVLCIPFTNNITATTGATRCGIGTADLTATASSGTIKWYTAASGGTSIGSGSPFTTPTISSTTNYYVGAESSSAANITVGSGASTTVSSTSSADRISPFDHYFGGFKAQYLFRASELTAMGLSAGNITGVALDIVSGGILYQGFNMSIGTTSATALTTTAVSGLTNVYSTTAPAGLTTPASGVASITFSSPFNWDGTSNIVIETCWSNNNTGGTGTTVKYDATSYASHNYYQDDSKTPAVLCANTSMTTVNSRPKVIFSGVSTCSSPRSTVTVTVNTPLAFSIAGNKTLCNNGIDSLSVTSTLSNYDSYTWSPVTGLFNDAACTSAYVAGSNKNKVYVKYGTPGLIKYICTANNSTSFCSNLDSAKIITLPAAVTVLATPSSICVSGSATLTMTPAPSTMGAATYQWASSTDNTSFSDITSATGNTYTTPTITSTKYYRVNIKNSAGVSCLNSTSDTGLVYNPMINTTTNGSRCGPGTVGIAATGSVGTINWYAASSGGSSLGTGTSFTTPSITSTTTYYAQVIATPDVSGAAGAGGATLGSSTGDNGLTPFSGYYEGQHTQHLILASDLISSGFTAGTINSLSFNVSGKNSTMAYAGYTVKIAPTTSTSLSGGLISPSFTTVYGPANYTVASGTNTFNFTSSFTWDGTSNIVVDVCFSNDPSDAGDYYTNNDAVTATTMSYVATYGWFQDNSALCGTTGGSSASSTKLPVITFNRTGCKSARTAVLATINTVPTPTISPATGPIQICEGNTTTLTGGGGGTYQWRDASGIIAGATSSTFTTGTTGSYRVIVTTPATGCKDSSAVVAVNVNPVPTVSIAPAGTVAVCADSAQKYTSVVTGTGLTYQWFNSGTLITGATTDKYSASTAGTYTLRVYLGSCSDTSNEAVLKINPLPASSFAKTGSTGAICLGSTLELTALSIPSTSTYQWMLNGVDIPGANSRVYNAPGGGIYTVRIKDSNNCRKISDTMSIINTPMGIPDLSPKDVRFCEGADIMLYSNAGPFAKTFIWNKDGSGLADTTATIHTTVGGRYDVTVTDVYGCTLKSSTVTITVDPLPVKPVITQTGNVLSTAPTYSTYQWYRNGKTIPGATKRSYTMSFDGTYHVVVSNVANCFNVSDMTEIKNLAVKTITRDDVKVDVYPNPTQTVVNIDADVEVNLMVRDIQGKQILELRNAKKVDMANYADGIYIFTITDKEGVVLKMDKVIKSSN